MATVTKLGPSDHGRLMSYDEFMAGDYEQGYKYEIIDGRLYVAPATNLAEYSDEDWLLDQLNAYARRRPKVINFVTNKARVFVPGRPGATVPEPDLAAYHNFPTELPFRERNWRKVSPILIGEILTEGDPDKDLVRNVELYRGVPSVEEYWIVDVREDPDRPTMTVHRRQGRRRWQIIEVAFGETYRTPLLPGFKLLLDPHK